MATELQLSKESLEIFLRGDKTEIKKHLNEHEYRGRYDIFVYTTSEGGPFVLCCNNNEVEPIYSGIFAEVDDEDPFQIGKYLMVWSYEFQEDKGNFKENVTETCYTFAMLQPKIEKFYFIGRYNNTGPRNFEFAALWSSRATVADLGQYTSRSRAFVVRFCERLIDYSDAEQDKDKMNEIIKNIEKMKKRYYKGVSQTERNSKHIARLMSVLRASVSLSDMSGLVLVLLCVGIAIYSVFLAIVLKVFLFKEE